MSFAFHFEQCLAERRAGISLRQVFAGEGRPGNELDGLFDSMFLWGEHGVVPLVPFFLEGVLGVDGHAVLCLHAVFPSRQAHQFVLVFPSHVIDLCLLAAQLYCFVFELLVEKRQSSLPLVDALL
jgi:hypothetical protein